MKTITHTVAGSEVKIFVPERRTEIVGFESFLAEGDKVLGFDTETTDLDIYKPGHGLRLAQFGNGKEAWVLRADLFADHIAKALRQPRRFTMHNAPFDLLVVDRHLGVKIEELADRVFDTRILAHLLDPRQPHEGGVGLRLKPLAEYYVDPTAPDTQEGLTAEFRRLGFKKADGFAKIPLDNELFLRYAGLDPVLAWHLFYALAPIVKEKGLNGLSTFEHHLQSLLAIMQRRGVLVDVEYTRRLRDELMQEAEEYRAVAKRYGVGNVNSTDQVAAALLAMGETLDEKTPSGKWKVDKEVLMALADLDRDWLRIEAREQNALANAVLRAKRAEKWATAYAEAFLDLRDGNDRLHATLGGLQARTGRMSVSRPPLQQLPAGDWKVRRALVADPGHLMIASDYSQVEMRVLAALCGDRNLTKAILDGVDLHDFAARMVFGEGFTKRQRSIAKAIGFGKVYGGGAATISRQTGAPIEDVKPALANYDRSFPGIKRYGRRLQERAQYGRREVVTPSGRHLPLDRDRLYAATNYVVQSTARDILAQAIVDIFDAGLGDYLLLPVHDEIIAQAPEAEAADVVAEIGKIMDGSFQHQHESIPILSDPEVYGLSWGSGYGCRVEKDDGLCHREEAHPYQSGVEHAPEAGANV